MTSNQHLQTLGFLSEDDDVLFEKWMKELQHNPHFSKGNMTANSQFKTQSKSFLSHILSTAKTEAIPSISKADIEPILTLWHRLLREHHSAGLSTKDTAMLIFSLKSTILNSLKDDQDQDTFNQVQLLLDLLGVLTFEIYTVENEALINRQEAQIHYLQSQSGSQQFKELIGHSPAIQQVYKAIGLVLENDVTILLEGESGTGKDKIATTIHTHSKRSKEPFITINCGAIPKELIESELFGHEKGAFTGADELRVGKFELAQGGTLFLDEISELSLDLQVKLLRVIQNREIERVGGKAKIPLDVRLIAATNKPLKAQVDKQLFRLDLYYRLNVFPISIPALRERGDDILLLADHFIQMYSKEFKLNPPKLTQDGADYLLNHQWEGNIRELENLIQRAIIISQGRPISSTILDFNPGKSNFLDTDSPFLLTEGSDNEILPLEELEKQAIIRALQLKNGNILQAAKALQVSRTTFYNKLEKYGITPDAQRR